MGSSGPVCARLRYCGYGGYNIFCVFRAKFSDMLIEVPLPLWGRPRGSTRGGSCEEEGDHSAERKRPISVSAMSAFTLTKTDPGFPDVK